MSRNESRSVTSATSKSSSAHEGLISASRSRTAMSFSRDRPATAHRQPLGACAARYSAVSPPVNPVAPKSTTSNSRPIDMAKHPSPDQFLPMSNDPTDPNKNHPANPAPEVRMRTVAAPDPTPKDLDRRMRQTRKDVEYAFDLIEDTNKDVKKVDAKVDNLTIKVDGVTTRVDGLTTTVDDLPTRVDGVTTTVDNLTTTVDGLTTRVDNLTTTVDGLTI